MTSDLVVTSVAPVASPKRSRARRSKFASYFVLSIGALVVLFPLYLAVVSSLLTPVQIGQPPPLLYPPSPQWHNYKNALVDGHLDTYLWNSILQTLEIVVGSVLTSLLAAFAFATFDFPLKKVLWALILATLLIPFEVTIVTNYQTISSTHLLGSLWALTIPFMGSAIGIFLLRQAFMAIPGEIREATILDGCGPMRYFWRVAVPLVRPQLAAFTVIAVLGAWNQYLWPLLLTSNDEAHRTLQIGLKTLNSGTFEGYGVVLAGAMIASVPMLILMVVFNRQLVRSLTGGAIK
jgi:sn-glycerol 3-phosphate transport system permease protein